jgi:hypothetical protein
MSFATTWTTSFISSPSHFIPRASINVRRAFSVNYRLNTENVVTLFVRVEPRQKQFMVTTRDPYLGLPGIKTINCIVESELSGRC